MNTPALNTVQCRIAGCPNRIRPDTPGGVCPWHGDKAPDSETRIYARRDPLDALAVLGLLVPPR